MSLFNPKIESPAVRVVPNGDQTLMTISWPANPGANGFKVYGGFDPLHVRSVISGTSLLPAGTTQFVFKVPFIVPPTQTLYFWVAAIDGMGNPTFVDDVGSYAIKTASTSAFLADRYAQETRDLYIMVEDQLYFFEEIRRRARAIMDDVGESEEIDLYIRQWSGLPDKTAQEALGNDSDYVVMTRSENSFGTGFFPGFFPAIRLKMRFGALPNSLLDYQHPGLRPLLTNEAWTLWEPLIHENDLIVRRSTGVRYVVSGIAPSNKQGVPIVQRITLNVVEPTSVLQKVTDPLVRTMWGQVNSTDYSRLGWGVAADQFGGPDYLLFSNG